MNLGVGRKNSNDFPTNGELILKDYFMLFVSETSTDSSWEDDLVRPPRSKGDLINLIIRVKG